VNSRVGVDGSHPSPPVGFDPRTVQPVASRYTDYATQPTIYILLPFLFLWYVRVQGRATLNYFGIKFRIH